MNCIILLLLLSCCSGWGNGGGSCNVWNGNDGCGECGWSRVPGRREPEKRGAEGRGSERRSDECCGEEERHSHDNCGCENNEREREREGCEVSGMIPPPWQEYPGFPRREGRKDDNCDACD